MKHVRTVGCFLEYNGKFVILHRLSHKAQGDTWGLPAGKVDPGETDEAAILRELWEETGYRASSDQLEFLGEYNFHFPDLAVTFPTFRIQLDAPFQIAVKPDEHQDHKWVTASECYDMPNTIHGLHDLLKELHYIPSSTA